MTFPKVFGILAGLCGILILLDIGKIWLDMTESISHINLIAQFTCLSGAFCYASSTVVIKKSPDCHPIVFSTIALIFSSIIFIAAAPLAGVPAIPDIEIKPFLAIIYLGVFSTALAAVLAVYIIRIAGTIFLSLGNYQEPVWALLIGSIFFNEAIPSQIIIALPLIIFGIAIATLSEKKRKITTNDSQ
jgi:drug/metabolite transporter (DMT)-like permease